MSILSDKETAQRIALRKELAAINRSLGADGVFLCVFSHTDDQKGRAARTLHVGLLQYNP